MKLLLILDTHIINVYSTFNANLQAVGDFIAKNPIDAIGHFGDITADGITHPAPFDIVAKSLGVQAAPVLSLPGNHDIGDNPIAHSQYLGQENTGTLKLNWLAGYRCTFGPDYRSLDLESWQLIGFNAQLFGADGEAETERFAWLKQSLRTRNASLGGVCTSRRSVTAMTTRKPIFAICSLRRLVELLAGCELKFALSDQAHQDHRIVVHGVEHICIRSATFCLLDERRERIGDKIAGVMTLELDRDGSHRLDKPEAEGLVRHNILDHWDFDPSIAAVHAKLGAAAEL